MNPFLLAVSADYRWYLDLELWSLVTFIALFAILAKFAAAPLLAALRGREQGIESQLREIDEAQREIRALRAEQEEKKRVLRAQAQEMVAEAKRDCVHLREEMIARAKEEIEKLKVRATREIELAKRKATHDLADLASNLAMEIAEKKLVRDLGPMDHDRLIGGAIGSMTSGQGGRS